MKLIIDVSNKSIVKLEKNGKIISQRQWDDKFDLDTRLLKEINRLIKNQKVGLKNIEKVEAVVGKRRFTTGRIAKATAEALNFIL